jgi:hypothetical protein
MAADVHKRPKSVLPRLGHASRLDAEGRQVTFLVLGHLVVFVAAMSHDELVAEMVEAGWFFARFAERFELLIGFLLFLCWSVLTLKLVKVIQKVRADIPPCEATDGDRR